MTMNKFIIFGLVLVIFQQECQAIRVRSPSRRSKAEEDYPDSEDNLLDHEPLPIVDNEQPRKARPYKQPGHWATPAPNSGIDLGFVPIQTYAQVRRTKSVEYLPRSEANKEAATADEILNAHRLKEVLRTKKVQEVYSEEGYEDLGYDHGDEERYAEHDEGFANHKSGRHKLKEPIQDIEDAAPLGSSVIEKRKKGKARPKVERKRVETSSMKFSYMNDFTESPSPKHKRAPKVTSKSTKRDFASAKDSFWNFPTSFGDLPVKKWGNDFEPIHRRKEKVGKEKNRVRIAPLPSVGYIHSLTDAHYGTQSPMVYPHPKPIPSSIINLTTGFTPERKKKSYPGFEAQRLNQRIKREIDENEPGKDTQDYEKELSKNLDEQKKKIVSSALNTIDFSSYHKSAPLPPSPPSQQVVKPVVYDPEKYPYFNDPYIEKFSPLRYASHPREFPRKSGYGMEFYEKKDQEIDCEPINVSLDDVPKENSTQHLSEQPGEKKRIVRLGDKIQCLKIKYFGEDPLDSPFFKEDELKKQKMPPPKLHYHSSYQYKPNRTIDVYLQNKHQNDSTVDSTQQQQVNYEVVHNPQNQTEPTVRPLIETFEQYPVLTTAAPIMGMRPPPLRYPYLPLSVLVLPPRPKPQKIIKSIKYKQNCLQPVAKMTISERSNEDIMYECNDVTLIRTTRDGNPHLQIIPKFTNRRTKLLLDESQDLRAGEVIEGGLFVHRTKRAAPESRRKSQLFPNKSLLDKLIKRPTIQRKQNATTEPSAVDLGIQSPDEISTPETSRALPSTKKLPAPTTTTTTTSTTTSATPPFKIERKPLPRLSGKDFLTRYHKAKGSKRNNRPPKNDEFWSVPSSTEGPVKSQNPPPPSDESEAPLKISRRISISDQKQTKTKRDESGKTAALLYVVDHTTGEGQWVREPTTESTIGSQRQMKKQNMRRVFFNRKLQKNE